MSKSFTRHSISFAIDTMGYVQLDAVDVSDPNNYLINLVSSFAKPISYFGQPIIMDVSPKEGANPASYAGTGKLDLHTDISWFSVPPMYIAMMCIDPGDGSGVPLIADGWKALADLDNDTIEILKTHEVSFAAPNHVNHWGHTAPILSQPSGKYQIRFRSDLLRDEATEAIDLFSKAVNKYAIHMEILPGSIWIVDNYRMLHGRTAINNNMSSKRFLKRLYASGKF